MKANDSSVRRRDETASDALRGFLEDGRTGNYRKGGGRAKREGAGRRSELPIPTESPFEFRLPKRELVYCQHSSDVTERFQMPAGRRETARASGGEVGKIAEGMGV